MDTKQLAYGFGAKVSLPYEAAVARTKDALKEQGFGIISEINMTAALREKLGVDFRPYVILGACNPPFAWQALQTEPDLGLLLPCNVVVYEDGEGSVVEAMDPEPVLGLVGNTALEPLAREVKRRLAAALEQVVAAA